LIVLHFASEPDIGGRNSSFEEEGLRVLDVESDDLDLPILPTAFLGISLPEGPGLAFVVNSGLSGSLAFQCPGKLLLLLPKRDPKIGSFGREGRDSVSSEL
jgi:hypothetical protein